MKETSVTATVTATTAKEVLDTLKTLAKRFDNDDDMILIQKTMVVGADATTLTAVFDLIILNEETNVKRVSELFIKILFPNVIAEITTI